MRDFDEIKALDYSKAEEIASAGRTTLVLVLKTPLTQNHRRQAKAAPAPKLKMPKVAHHVTDAASQFRKSRRTAFRAQYLRGESLGGKTRLGYLDAINARLQSRNTIRSVGIARHLDLAG